MRIFPIAFFMTILLTSCGSQEGGEAVTVIEFGENGETTTRNSRSVKAETETAETVPTSTPSAAANSACKKTGFEGAVLIHCVADPNKHRISTALGPPYRSFAKLAEARGDNLPVFAVNGGMFDDDGQPIGYYVEKGKRLQQLNRADGPGNFHLKPNGVFYGSNGKWRVRTSDNFYAHVSDRPQFGTQSGPMLVIGAKLHPEITENGPSRQIRNGVGVDSAGRAHFVKSETPLSFGAFARFFRDVAKTPNALYLDGNVSALWDPATNRMDRGAALGPLIVVDDKAR